MGKYQLIRKLATGGMAEVFLAKSSGPLGFEKLLVVKRILPHLAEDPQFVEMFLGEAKLAARLNHANIVQIFDFGLEGDSYFIAMEYVDGVDLRTIKRRAFHQDTPIAFPVCARLVSLACEGLAYAHELADPMTGKPLRLIHRDISPDNIFASKTGGLKILDFGIAKVTNAGQRTESGVLKGKVPYMAPEYLLGEAIDARIDVYALGVVLFELVTGHRPYRSDNDVRLIHAVLNDSLPDVRNFRQGIPEQLIHILTRALAKDRDQRYASCREFHADLERFLYLYSEPVGAVQIARFVQELSDPAHSDAVNAGESVPTTPEPRLLLDAASMQSPRSATTQRAPAPAPSPPPPEPIGAATEQLTAPMPAPRRAPLESVGADTEPLTAPLPGPPRRTPPEQLAPRRSVPRLEAKPATVPRRHAPDSGAAVTRRKPTRPETAIPPARPQGWLRRNLVWWASPLVTALVIMAVAGLVPSGASSESPGAVVPPVKARPSTTKAETGPSPSPVIVSALVQPEAPPAWRATTDARAASMAIEEAALAEAPTPEATIGNEGMALVRVTSKLPGEVRINGIKAGPTPLEHPAAPGTVRLSIDGVHKGNRFSKEAELALAADERRDFEFEIQPVTFTIRGRPDDMQVIKLDGRELHGQLKVTSYEGYHRLQLYHPPTEKEYTAFCKVEPRDKYCKFDVKLTP